MCSHELISRCDSYDKSKKILNQVQGIKDKMSHELSRVYEWSKITAAKHAAFNNTSLLTNLRRDIPSYSPNSDRQIGSTRFYALTAPDFSKSYF